MNSAPPSGAFEACNRSIVFLDDAISDRQAEPGTLADFLGGEERIEDARQHVGRRCPFPYRARVTTSLLLVDAGARLDRPHAIRSLDRVFGVDQEVEERLLQQQRIAGDRRQRFGKAADDRDAGAFERGAAARQRPRASRDRSAAGAASSVAIR